MKAFFEEYGFVLVSIVVVMLLVGMTGTVGKSIEQKVGGLVNSLTFDSTNNKVTYTEPTPQSQG